MNKLDFSKIKEKLSKLGKGNKKVMFTGAAFVIIALALVISIYLPKNTRAKTKTESGTVSQTSITEYASMIETKLQNMLLQVDSVNKVSAFVMVDSTPEIKYLTQTEEVTTSGTNGQTSSTKSTTVVFEKNGSIQTPVVVTTVMPKVTGVLIVLNNISASTKYNIIRAVAIVLNVEESCINILQES